MADANNKPRRPAAFLDRDGVLNVDRGYTHQIDQLEWIAGAIEGVRLVNEAGFYACVVTNQSGVARGLYDEAAVVRIHAHMHAFYYCPHHPDGTIKELAIQCRCRKPMPGMLEQAARDWPVDLGRSFLIGDTDHVVAADAAFHIRGIKFDVQAGSLADLVRKELRTRSP